MIFKQLFNNNAVSLLRQAISAADTTLVVLAGQGAMFPSPGENEFFTVTLEDQSALEQEIVHVFSRSDDVFTIVRGREGTTARAWSAAQGNDTLVDHRVTAATLARLANDYQNPSFTALTNYSDALDYLLQGNPTSGGQEVDAPVTTTINGAETVISLPSNYKPGTTAVYIGGVRQKRGVDFIESGAAELRLQFILSDTQIEEGQNLVVDYVVA
jgi:hypothetical protein